MTITEVVSRALTTVPAGLHEFARGRAVKTALEVLDGFEPARNGKDLFCREYKISVGLRSALDDEARSLESIRDLELSIAPVALTILQSDPEGYLGVLITQYRSCTDEQLVPVGERLVDVPEAAKARFRLDVEKLGANGFVHPFIRGWYHVLVSSESRTLVMDDWLAMRRGTASEIDEMIAHARRMTGQR